MREYETNQGTDAIAARMECGGAKTKGRDGVEEGSGPRFNSTLLAFGVGVVLLGCLLFMDNLFNSPFGVPTKRLWPIIIVAVGVAKLIEQRCRRTSGWIILLVGALLLWHSIGGLRLGDLIGPAILISVGVFMVLHARRRRLARTIVEGAVTDAVQRFRGGPQGQDSTKGEQREGDFACGTAIVSSYKYKPSGGVFCGGDVTAVFGGFEMDLSQMTMESESANLDTFVLFGGGEICVPDGWGVSVRVSALAGGVEDKSISPPSIQGQPPKLLIITGSVMFGGITVKTRSHK